MAKPHHRAGVRRSFLDGSSDFPRFSGVWVYSTSRLYYFVASLPCNIPYARGNRTLDRKRYWFSGGSRRVFHPYHSSTPFRPCMEVDFKNNAEQWRSISWIPQTNTSHTPPRRRLGFSHRNNSRVFFYCQASWSRTVLRALEPRTNYIARLRPYALFLQLRSLLRMQLYWRSGVWRLATPTQEKSNWLSRLNLPMITALPSDIGSKLG